MNLSPCVALTDGAPMAEDEPKKRREKYTDSLTHFLSLSISLSIYLSSSLSMYKSIYLENEEYTLVCFGCIEDFSRSYV